MEPARQQWDAICRRATSLGADTEAIVCGIIARVRAEGDAALISLAAEIDGIQLSSLKVSEAEFAEAASKVSPEVKQAIEKAYANIHAFHAAQMPKRIEVETSPGVVCIQKPVPIGKVGMYIPGGTAPLFSTVLMLAVPAQIAGCPVRVLCTPTGKDGKVSPEVLYTAQRCGITEVFKAGGAQAVAAMAYGTATIPSVDKIFGPGNRFVTMAKQLVSTDGTSIDMPAGPSEVMVLADAGADPAFVAADLLSQAEHGRDSQVILVSNDRSFSDRVLAEVDRQAALLPRGEMIASSLSSSRAVVFQTVDEMLAFADHYAPEHLIISMENAAELAERINCAGSVFVGKYSPESAGDYASGTNHTLPTSGWARSCSGVNLESFMRRMTIQNLSAAGLRGLSDTIVAMAEAEGLEAHANAVKVRMDAVAGQPDEGFRLESIVRPNILALCPYSTARDEYQGELGTFLDANESPFENGFNRYPDPHQKVLKQKVAAYKGIDVRNLFLGNGSDEAIDLVYRVFCNPGRDNVVSICPSYGMYKVAAATNDIEFREVRLRDDFSLDTEALFARVDALTRAIFICSPNNPSGNAFPMDQILSVARRFRGIVVVDEAYVDFSDKGSAVAALADCPNIIVLQTLSKAWGLAGLRIGLAIADERIIRLMSMVKYPYNISKAAQQEAMKVLEQPVDAKVVETLIQRKRLEEALPGMPHVIKVWPSDANFLLVEFDDACAIYDALIDAGIIVRNRNSVPGCAGCLRITVGTPEENDKLIETLRTL